MVTSQDCIKKYGSPLDEPLTSVNEQTEWERRNMTLFSLFPNDHKYFSVFPSRIYCNKDLLKPLYEALSNVVSKNLQEQIKTWDGCFNIRKKRGLNSLSLHSFGIAIDINATWNQLGKEPTMSPELVKCFTDAGFDWGGTWKRKDGMHFQLSKI